MISIATAFVMPWIDPDNAYTAFILLILGFYMSTKLETMNSKLLKTKEVTIITCKIIIRSFLYKLGFSLRLFQILFTAKRARIPERIVEISIRSSTTKKHEIQAVFDGYIIFS